MLRTNRSSCFAGRIQRLRVPAACVRGAAPLRVASFIAAFARRSVQAQKTSSTQQKCLGDRPGFATLRSTCSATPAARERPFNAMGFSSFPIRRSSLRSEIVDDSGWFSDRRRLGAKAVVLMTFTMGASVSTRRVRVSCIELHGANLGATVRRDPPCLLP